MRWGLKPIVFLCGAVLLLVPAIVAGTMFTNAMQQRAEAANSARLRLPGEMVADQLGQRMHQLWLDVEALGQIASLDNSEEARRQFTFLTRVDHRVSWVGVADPEGKVIAASNGMLEGASVAERPWFRRGLNGPAATDVHEAVLLEKLLPAAPEPRRFVDFSAPIKAPDGAVLGVIGAHFDWNWVRESFQSFKGPGLDVLLVSRDQTVLLGPGDLQGTKLAVGSAIAAGQAVSTSLREQWPDGREYMTAVIPAVRYKDMPSFGWSVIVRAESNTVLDPTRAISHAFWMLLGGGLLVALGLLFLLVSWITKPLHRLIATGERLASGRMDEPPHDETRYREVARLSALLVRLQTHSVRPYQPAGKARKGSVSS
ncbi:cache domain-containing protein [Microvirga tunisiensis]|uniref:HAMP domain-containing protein n=1 Tax=Microvirga tunisiensis TaxID=2108360 RepID=A0A5N7N441_9HYPH|nr:cache domain-containing protein [Microvirga tunisiensis]MPR12409.1 HAMP domain-containing protein [Microvirga tunisiensis]MPR30326.1 HAMP domain-containing protein [Microvirga tunisiensis]